MLGVSSPYLEQIAVVSGDVVDLEHLRTGRERFGNLVGCQGLLASDSHEGEHALVENSGIDLRCVTADDAARLQFANPFEDGRRGEPDGSSNLSMCLAAVFLKKLQNHRIYVVDSSVYSHNDRMILEIGRRGNRLRIDDLMVALKLLYQADRPPCTGRYV